MTQSVPSSIVLAILGVPGLVPGVVPGLVPWAGNRVAEPREAGHLPKQGDSPGTTPGTLFPGLFPGPVSSESSLWILLGAKSGVFMQSREVVPLLELHPAPDRVL
jgi:hypothetical protein